MHIRQLLPTALLAMGWIMTTAAATTRAATATTNATTAPATQQASVGEPFAVDITIDAGKTRGELRPIWRFFGYDEPNYTYMKDGKRLVGELTKLRPGQVFFRTHGLLCTGDGTAKLKWGSTNAYTEDASGNPVYDWTIVDRIFDTYLQQGGKPYVQIGFMPQALSTNPDPYTHNWKPGDRYSDIWLGWTYPPKDYGKWRELCKQWVLHCVEKYGKQEVEGWYWELWNEPNIGYFKGTPQEYHKLYDYTVDGVRAALPTAKVGGPHVTGGGEKPTQWLREFLEHCVRGKNYATGQVGTPIDFIGFHAKGSPRMVDGHVRMGISNQLRDIDTHCKTIASFPELKDKPIIIGESDPDGCAACPSSHYPQNAYRGGTLFSSYTAATFSRKQDIAESHGVNLEGATTWAFEFEDQPYFAGFRVLSTNQIDLPVMNVFRMYAKMNGQRLTVTSSSAAELRSMIREGVRGEKPDVHALAALDEPGKSLTVLTWHYHDDDVAGPAAAVKLALSGLPAGAGEKLKLTRYVIDENHANAYAAWKRMGSPQPPTPEQHKQLEQAAKLEPVGEEETVNVSGGATTLNVELPRQGVTLLKFGW